MNSKTFFVEIFYFLTQHLRFSNNINNKKLITQISYLLYFKQINYYLIIRWKQLQLQILYFFFMQVFLVKEFNCIST